MPPHDSAGGNLAQCPLMPWSSSIMKHRFQEGYWDLHSLRCQLNVKQKLGPSPVCVVLYMMSSGGRIRHAHAIARTLYNDRKAISNIPYEIEA